MTAGRGPAAAKFFGPWFWAHDIRESQIPGLVTAPDASLAYLRSYGEEAGLRYAAVVCRDIGRRSWSLGLSAAEVTAGPVDASGTPVSIDSHRSGGEWCFTLLGAPRSGTGRFVSADLTGKDVRAVLRAGHHIVDHTAYWCSSSCRYAVVFARGSLSQDFVERSSMEEVHRAAAKRGAWPVQIRSCGGAPAPHRSAVLCGTRQDDVRPRWHADLDADGLSHVLHRRSTVITDFHVLRGTPGARFTVATHAPGLRNLFGK